VIEQALKLIVRTPREVVLELDILSLRAPTATGQVGVRPRVEPLVLAIEPGLVLVRQDDGFRFIGTAGGLLRCDGERASLLTPLAVAGKDEDDVLAALEQALAQPNVELEARATLSRLEGSILRELRHGHKEKLQTLGDTG
jgi:F0F1-type ATP synthase epsilon subunit